jgi:DNA-directed RNA polymerase subunit F
MATLEIVEKKPINMSVLREELADIKKRDGELSFRGAKTEEYVTEFASLKPKQAEELYAKIEKINIPRMKDSYINKIIDMLPASVAELKVIMQGYALPVTNENLKKIVDCVAEFIPKKKEEKKEDNKEEASKQKPADKKEEKKEEKKE